MPQWSSHHIPAPLQKMIQYCSLYRTKYGGGSVLYCAVRHKKKSQKAQKKEHLPTRLIPHTKYPSARSHEITRFLPVAHARPGEPSQHSRMTISVAILELELHENLADAALFLPITVAGLLVQWAAANLGCGHEEVAFVMRALNRSSGRHKAVIMRC
jgi:hypothetical protein